MLFSYQPVHDDELELKVDQVLEFMGEVEDGWWKGRSQQTGKVRFLIFALKQFKNGVYAVN